jgi:hypothetical protein
MTARVFGAGRRPAAARLSCASTEAEGRLTTSFVLMRYPAGAAFAPAACGKGSAENGTY